ncbi:MAG: prepilin-type N-terminal cleavage/methylation domain-containing protein [Firmicutes bacterium]|nr:prepilin-type N-terminal cleavage/methylation domain-containing protein [Bacillota bacterium]
MFNRFARLLKNRKGFTLVELMVVVVIIGILAGIAVPVYNSSQNTAKINAYKADVRTLMGAGVQYTANNGNPATKVTWDGSASQTWSSYLQSWPTNPYTAADSFTVEINTDGTVVVKAGSNTCTLTPGVYP